MNIKKIYDLIARIEMYLSYGDTIVYTDCGQGSAGDGYLTWDIWEELKENYTPYYVPIFKFEKEFNTKLKQFYRMYDFLDTKYIECFVLFIDNDDDSQNPYRVYVPVYRY